MRAFRVLFVCIHNSARSQMAEAFLNKLGNGMFVAESAGLTPGTLNPNVVEALQEIGIDISAHGTQSVFDLFKQGRRYDAIVTVCDAASAEQCPIFPGKVKRIAWAFPDPSTIKGTKEEILQHTREIRDSIERKVADFISDATVVSFWI
jgi:arsenate reductase